jgi:TrmH family RNA methyltransferase
VAVAEGVRLVEEALAAGVRFEGVIVARDFGEQPRQSRLLADLAAHAVAIEEVARGDLDRLADTETPQGILAVVEPPRWTLDQITPGAGQPVLVLDGIQDPGNVGTLLRTGFALGAAGAIVLAGTADPVHPKVLRAAMGATFRFPTAHADDRQLGAWLRRHRTELWVAAADGAALPRAAPPEFLALAVGNEGAGVRPAIRALATRQVAIPLARGVESLNVAVAAGILLHEVRPGA